MKIFVNYQWLYKVIIVGLIIFLISMNMILFTYSLHMSDQVKIIQNEINLIEKENSILNIKLSSLTAIPRLEKVADLLGLTNVSYPESLSDMTLSKK